MINAEFEKLIEKRPNIEINNFSIDMNEIKYGVVFMFSSWRPSTVQLRNLISSLENFPDLALYIFDIDEDKFYDFKKKNMLYSDGWGETFWIKNGKIIADLKKYNSQSIKDLIRNNVNVIN